MAAWRKPLLGLSMFILRTLPCPFRRMILVFIERWRSSTGCRDLIDYGFQQDTPTQDESVCFSTRNINVQRCWVDWTLCKFFGCRWWRIGLEAIVFKRRCSVLSRHRNVEIGMKLSLKKVIFFFQVTQSVGKYRCLCECCGALFYCWIKG